MEILSENKEEEIHVLMVALSSQGHINPMLRLGKRLVNKGLHVTLATTEFTRRRMLKSSTINPTASSISISGVQVRFFSDGQNLDYDGKINVDSYMENLANFGAITDVAISHGIPCAMVWIQPCSLFAIYYRFYNKLSSLPTLTDPEMSVELPGLPLLRAEDLPSYLLPSNPFGSLPKLLSDMFQNMKKYKWVLGNSFFGLERDAIESMADLCPISPIGPLVPPSLLGEDEDHDSGTVEMWKREDTCIEWLNKEAPSSPTNAKLIADIFRNGLRLRANQDGIVSNEEVEKCIREIMDGPKSVELKSNARELRVAAREAVAGAGSSDKNIQLFVDEIIRSCGSIVKGSCNDTS
ncbi:hypothetical protein OIU77_028782 [Salix suchowensis]|uniref:Uncharacterized protein n=1 Tax=Salix suchowensis TaxID=1278906 RepID=A0ABQ9BIK4_9ROSI|nr:hypothetical protein OIU77_028782 [Salix suchowensis]